VACDRGVLLISPEAKGRCQQRIEGFDELRTGRSTTSARISIVLCSADASAIGCSDYRNRNFPLGVRPARVCTDNLNTGVVVMKSAQDGV